MKNWMAHGRAVHLSYGGERMASQNVPFDSSSVHRPVRDQPEQMGAAKTLELVPIQPIFINGWLSASTP